MSSAIGLPVIIAISSGAGVIVLASTAITVFLILHRKRKIRLNAKKENIDTTVRTGDPIDARLSCDLGESPPTKRSWRPKFRAFSERNLKSSDRSISDEPARTRNVLQRKRYGGVRASSLPVFSIVAPRIPSPTLSLGKQSVLFEEGESYMLSPIADSDVATVGGSPTPLSGQWPLPPKGTGALQQDALRPRPLFEGYSRTSSGHFIPSAHPPRTSSNVKLNDPIRPPARHGEHPGLKRFMSDQQIGQAPTGALPAPPPGRLSSLRDSHTRVGRSRSSRSRSMESLISGTSSILRSTSSPVAGRKRSATEAHRPTLTRGVSNDASYFVSDYGKLIELRETSSKAGRQLSSHRSGGTSRSTRPPLRTHLSGSGSGDDSSLPRNKSSALSVALMNARMPHSNGPTSSRTSSSASRPSAPSNKPHNSPSRRDAPAVQSPSPKRFVRGYRLLQESEAPPSPTRQKASGNWPLRVQVSQDPDSPKGKDYKSGTRPVKPFVSHLPRSPRPEDRPAGFRLTPRSQTSSGRGSPIERVLPPGAEQSSLAITHSKMLLHPTPPQSCRNRSSPSETTTASQPLEPVTCGDLASYLRRTDSLCEADDGAGYFNLTGGTCTSPREPRSSWTDAPSIPSSPLDNSSPDPPLYGRSTRTSGFYTPSSIPAEPSPTRSPSLSIDQEPGLTPNTSSSPHTDNAWFHGSSERSVGGLGLGLAGRFDITATGLNFSPASSPVPSPCPSPPPRSTLRNTWLAGFGNAVARDAAREHPVGLQKLDGGRAREVCVVGSEEAPAVRRPEEGWCFWDTRAAHEAEEHSAEMARDMQLAAQRSRVVVHESGYPVEARDRRSLLPPSPTSPDSLPGMAF